MSGDERKSEASQPANLFGALAVSKGLLQPQQVEECLEIQQMQRRVFETAGPQRADLKADPLGEIVKRRGYMDEQGVQAILEAQAQVRGEAPGVEVPPGVEPGPGAAGALFPEPGERLGTASSGAGKRQLGDFELLGKLGQGAMGAVYLARQVSLDRRVALKILPPELAQDKEFLERFRREARAAARLNHPNIVMAYDVGTVAGYHYIAMEWVDGRDLEEGLKSRSLGRYAVAEVLKIASDMAKALEAASVHGIVHRDIKPANILKNSDGTYKLTDLGLAARSTDDRRVTQTGLAVGTPFYISPEQARGEQRVDIRADIYSLGATLYHLATGRLPFADENAVVVMTKHISETLKPPSEVQPTVPKTLSRLIEKMMAKRPEDRHQNARELLEDIRRASHGEVPLLKRARAKPRSTTEMEQARAREAERAAPAAKAPDKPAPPKPADRPPGPSPRVSTLPSGHPRLSRAPQPRTGTTGPARPTRGLSRTARQAILLGLLFLLAVCVGVLATRLRGGSQPPGPPPVHAR